MGSSMGIASTHSHPPVTHKQICSADLFVGGGLGRSVWRCGCFKFAEITRYRSCFNKS